jgi:hypothetical protein
MFTKAQRIGLVLSCLAFVISSINIAYATDSVTKPRSNEVAVEMRTFERSYVMDVPSTAAATDITAGVDGVICAPTINSNATPKCNGATIKAMPYPAKLDIKVHDDSNADTLVCTSVLIRCRNQFGEQEEHTVYPIAETVLETNFCCEQVTYVAGAGCTSNSGDASDVLRVSASAELCLPVNISSTSDVLQVSIWDTSASELFSFLPAALTIDTRASSVELDNLTPTLAAGDVVSYRVRAP